MNVLITGAASGIGRACALRFAGQGWVVGCYDIDADGARRAAQEAGAKAVHGGLDVTNAESWGAATAAFAQAAPRGIDVLLNSAGIARMGRFEDVSAGDCRRQLDVNVMGFVLGVQACLPELERARGRIVSMSSASAIYGQPELAVYSASKFAVRALTEALDIELRVRGVTVCDVMPSYVDTPMVRAQAYRAKSVDDMGVNLTAEDVAAVVWKAAHGRGLHYIPQPKMRIFSRLSGMAPELARAVMQRYAFKG